MVSLATVLAMKPEVLLLDEPTTGLDSSTTEKIIYILSEIEMSYVFISHNMDFLDRTTDKIYGMENGKVLTDPAKIPHTHFHIHECGQISHTHDDIHEK